MASPSSVHQVRVRYGETDQMGVVHHANYLAYLEEAREYMERIEQELMREHLVAEAAILHNATLRYVRDLLPSGSQEREKAVTVVVYRTCELDDIISLMKGMKHLDTYSTFYEEAARFWFAIIVNGVPLYNSALTQLFI